MMNKLFILLSGLILCSHASAGDQRIPSPFDYALRFSDIAPVSTVDTNWKKVADFAFGEDRLKVVPANMELGAFWRCLSNSNCWKVTSIANGVRFIGQIPNNLDVSRICFDFGLDFNGTSEGEDLKVVVFLDDDRTDFAKFEGEELVKKLKSSASQPRVVGYMLIEKGNLWFRDHSSSKSAAINRTRDER